MLQPYPPPTPELNSPPNQQPNKSFCSFPRTDNVDVRSLLMFARGEIKVTPSEWLLRLWEREGERVRAEKRVKRVHIDACLSGFDRRVNRIEIGHCFGDPRSKPRPNSRCSRALEISSRKFGFDFQFRIARSDPRDNFNPTCRLSTLLHEILRSCATHSRVTRYTSRGNEEKWPDDSAKLAL